MCLKLQRPVGASSEQRSAGIDVFKRADGRATQRGNAPAVLACTLLAYDPQFELGPTLQDANRDVRLNHPHCAKFCVLGGASCRGKRPLIHG